MSLWTPLCCYVATVHLFSQSLSIVLRCGNLLLNDIFSFWRARCIRWPSLNLIRVDCRCVIDVMLLHCVCCTRLIRTLIIVCSVSLDLLLSEFNIPSCGCSSSIGVCSIKVWNVPICKTFLASWYFFMWNDPSYTVFDTGVERLREQSIVGCFPELYFSIFRGSGACGVSKAIYKQFCFSQLGLCCWL